MTRTITCIVCPRGCAMTLEDRDGALTVSGQGCKRGEKHAIAEHTNPVRSLTSVVRVSNRVHTMVPVKTATPIPKEEMLAIMARIRAVSVEAPVAVGQTILADICGTALIATDTIL